MVDKIVHATGGSDEWETPQDLYDQLYAEFQFTLDPCATTANAKCDRFFTIAGNGLAQSWRGERVFMNPPYGSRGATISHWLTKAFSEAVGRECLTVALIPARTDTLWWHNTVRFAGEVRFIKGRVKYLLDGKQLDAAPFPSALVVFRPQLGRYTWHSI